MSEGRPGATDAVVAVIVRDGRVLFVRRAPGRPAAGYWCPPSGRIEPGESWRDAVVREVGEELGLAATPVRHLATLSTEDGSFVLHYWRTEVTGSPRLLGDESTDLLWCTAQMLTALEPTFGDDVRICVAELGR